MAQFSEIIITLDEKITATRIRHCIVGDCQFREFASFCCQFKEIEIGEEGKCLQYQKVPV